MDEPGPAIGAEPARPPSPDEPTGRLSFRTRLTAALIGVAILPLIAFGLLVVLIGQAVGGAADGRRLRAPPAVRDGGHRHPVDRRLLPPGGGPHGARCGRSRPRWTGPPPATCRPRSGWPARTSWLGSPRATTASRPTSTRRNRELANILAAIRDDLATRRGRDARRARRGRRKVRVRDDRRGHRPRRPIVRAGGGGRPRRDTDPARTTSASGRTNSGSCWAGCRRRGAGSARTRTCWTCSRARSRSVCGTRSCSSRSRRRTSSFAISMPPRTTSCAASATTSRRP